MTGETADSDAVPPECEYCGREMVLLEEDTIMGDKYGCKNEACRMYVEEEPL